MTNLEFYKDEIKRLIHNEKSVSISECVGKAFEKFCSYHIDNFPFNSKRFIDWLLEENTNKIKLKRWEYDLLEYSKTAYIKRFSDWFVLRHLKSKGNFKGITDTSLTIKEILENSEVENE